jgi:hypothetical protein
MAVRLSSHSGLLSPAKDPAVLVEYQAGFVSWKHLIDFVRFDIISGYGALLYG